MLTGLAQIAFRAQSAAGTYESGTDANTYLKTAVYNLNVTMPPDFEERNPQRGIVANTAGVAGKKTANISFDIDWKGSGTAGTAPAWIALLNACGNTQADATSSAAYTQPVWDPKFKNSTAAFSPALTGTYGGTKTGVVNARVKSLSAGVNVVLAITFFPNDGTAAVTADITFTDNTATSITSVNSGLSLALGINPGSSTAGVILGDQWNWTVSAANHAKNTITPANDPNTAIILSMAVYSNGILEKFRDARGNCKATAKNGGILKLHFDFTCIPLISSGQSDTGMLTGAAWDATIPPAFLNVTLTDGGTQVPCFTEFEFDMGNTVAYSECSGEATGVKTTTITARKPMIKIDPKQTLIATDNPFTRFFAGYPASILVFSVGSDAGNIITLTAQSSQLNDLGRGDMNGEITRPRSYGLASPEYEASGNYYPYQIALT